MRHRLLGRTGLLVSELCLGTNTFGGTGPIWSALGALGQDDVTAVLRAAHEAGINFIDTADSYGGGDSERLIAGGLKALGIERSQMVIATKTGGATGTGPNDRGGSRHRIMAAVEDSLKRLGTDYLDVYMMHFPDPATPIEESLRALDDLVRAGKVRYVGCSNFRAWEAMRAIGVSEREGLARFAIMEMQWSAATRDVETEIVPMARAAGIGLLVWGPMLGGLLSGKYDRAGGGEGRTGGHVPPTIDRERLFDVVDALRTIAERRGVPVSRVALAWLLAKPQVTSVLFGARTAAQVGQNAGASDVRLDADEVAAIDAIYPPRDNYGIEMVSGAWTDRPPHL